MADIEAVLGDICRQLTELSGRLTTIEQRMSLSVVKETYSVEEVAERLGRAKWTVAQWCNLGQAKALKKPGRGRGEWRIPHEELIRLENEGPIPLKELLDSDSRKLTDL